MNCSRFQNEYESGSGPNGEGLAHLESCGKCRVFVKEEESLNQLLSALPDVGAPGDFGTAVNERIASGRGGMGIVWAGARIALPVAAMLLIVGAVVMNSSLFVTNDEEQKPLAVKTEPAQVEKQIEKGIPKETTAIANNPQEVVAAPEIDEPDTRVANESKNRSEPSEKDVKPVEKQYPVRIQSIDQASEEVDVVNPPGLNPERAVEPAPNETDKSFTAKEILRTLGVDAEWERGLLVVGSVEESGIAARSGIKKGDQIRSIDGREVAEGTMSKGVVSGKIIRVVRGGKEFSVSIRSN